MAYLDPQEAFEHFSGKVVESVKQYFPVKGREQTLHLEHVEVRDNLHPDDIRSQHKAKDMGATWSVPIYGTFVLKDNATDKTIARQTVRMVDIPKMTKRYSYIVGGQEYQVDHQWQLKPGAYARRRQNGQLEVQFNVTGPGSKSFDMLFDPAKRQFQIMWNKATLPAYPILSTMGVTDEQLTRAWGKDLLEANKQARGVVGALSNAFRSDKGRNPSNGEEAKEYVWSIMQASKMNPDVTTRTLGRAHEHVDGTALLTASKRILDMQQGGPEDDRDSLVYKRLRGVGDYAQDKIRGLGWQIRQKMLRKVDSAQSIRDVVKSEHFNGPISLVFSKNQAARIASQCNPLEMVSSNMQTTVRGPGGIQSEHGIIDETKFINPSHFGFLDPILTPEGSSTGVSLRLPLGIKKIGDEPHIPLYNLRTNRMEWVAPTKAMDSNLMLPDQVTWKDGHPTPIASKVKMLGKANDLQVGLARDADYVMRHPTQVFNITSNMIPFLHCTQGNRAGMAGRHMEQAISLQDREAPLVQVGTGATSGHQTFEQMIGHQTSHTSPVAGKIAKVERDRIIVQSDDGHHHEVQLYDNYPLNDPKALLHSTPTVRVGDHVQKGQHVADTNFSKGGTLALGTNLRVAYMPFHGYNHDDGIVMSEGAAKKMASIHLVKPSLLVDEHMSFDPKRFRVLHPGTYKVDQLDTIGQDGVVKVGTKVRPGDPLILATSPFQLHDRVGIAAIRKNSLGVHTDRSVRWEGDFPGEVVGTHRRGGAIYVHVKTIEPMQVADKAAGRHGNKGVCSQILPDDQMPRSRDGRPIEVLLNPIGVPSRINPGQIFETVAGKIAQKTGRPYVVKSFTPGVDQIATIKREARAHGIDTTEELFDPQTGLSLGKVQTGPLYMLKQVHQVEKKTSVRSGMSLPGGHVEHYDQNLMPTGGGHTGGQSIGQLGFYALLAYGSKALIREGQTIKSEGPDPQTNEGKRWRSQHNEVWRAIQNGTPIPTPRPTFAFQKFTDYLRGCGINMEKRGHQFVLGPLTDRQVHQMSSGPLPKPDLKLTYKLNEKGELVPVRGGLFDEHLTGGHGGTKWSHIDLAEPVPNPVFERAIKSLTGLQEQTYRSILSGRLAVMPNGQTTDNTRLGQVGGAAIEQLLRRIDVPEQLKRAQKDLAGAPAAKVDQHLKRVRYLQALERTGMRPDQAYVLHALPVLPPVMRPATILPNGTIKESDINSLYAAFGQLNRQLGDPIVQQDMTDRKKEDLRAQYHDGVKALMGVGIPYSDQKEKGLLHLVAGPVHKEGFFQRTLMNRRQDLTMRSVIIPEPALGLDEVGVPAGHAMELFRPFVIRQLVQSGAAAHPLSSLKGVGAEELIARNDPLARQALIKVMEDKPVLLKRDPVLHKYGVMGFRPKLVEGRAIRVHPLVTSGYGADFDGDAQCNMIFFMVKNGSKAAITLLEDEIGYWSSRKAPVEMTARMQEIVGYQYEGNLYMCDLQEFPHLPDHVTKGHIDYHGVPDGIEVVSYDEQNGSFVFAPVRGWSIHRDREVEIVRLASGREIVTDDDERAVYGLDEQLLPVRRRPCEAVGLFVPTVHGLNFDQPVFYMPLPVDKRLLYGVRVDLLYGRLLGHLVGNGWASHLEGDAKAVSVAATDEGVREGYELELCCLFKCLPNITTMERTGGDFGPSVVSCRHTVACTAYAEHIDPLIGHGADDKHLPPFFLSTPREFKVGLLAGLIDTDGSISVSHGKAKPQWMSSYSSNSLRLVREISLLCHALSIRTHITPSSTPGGKDCWMLTISTVDLHKLGGLPLVHTRKRLLADEFFAGPPPEEKNSYSKFDIVPTPAAVALEIRKYAGTGLGGASYTAISKAVSVGYMTRYSAKEVLSKTNIDGLSDLVLRWADLVCTPNVRWDRVVEYDVTHRKETGYDLTVPGYETFMAVDGTILSNTMSMYVPIGPAAEQEARRMMPSNNLFANASGKVMFQPKLESNLGLYCLTRTTGKTNHKFESSDRAIEAARAGTIPMTSLIHVDGVGDTTAGRLMVAAALPEPLRHSVQTDQKLVLDKKGLDGLLTDMARLSERAGPHRNCYGPHVNLLKDLGNGAATGLAPIGQVAQGSRLPETNRSVVRMGAATLNLEDLEPDRQLRDGMLRQAQHKVDAVMSKQLTTAEKERQAVDIWTQADRNIQAAHNVRVEAGGQPSNLYLLRSIGKPSADQYKQLVLSPMLVKDTAGRTIPHPITKSFSEGQDVSDYWIGMYGARRGAVRKVQEVQEPGVISKEMQNTAMDMLVAAHDCGTDRGIALSVTDPQLHDRYLAAPFHEGDLHVPANTMLTPDVVGQIRAVRKDAQLLVRSPLKCRHEQGVCQKCMGLAANGQPYEIGHNVGVEAAHSHGERTTQLMLSSFHSGGVAGTSRHAGDEFEMFKQLVELPANIPDQATIAMKSGKVENVRHDKLGCWLTVGGHDHFIGRDRTGAGLHEDLPHAKQQPGYQAWQPPTAGMTVQAGQILSDPNRTVINPRQLYQATNNMDVVQNHLAQQIHNIFGKEGIVRRQTELLVKAMTNTTRIQNAGDHPEVLRGEYRNASWVKQQNALLQQQGRRPITHQPELKGIDVLPLSMREDWMAKLMHDRLRNTILENAAAGGVSDLHGNHPVPAAAYGAEFGMTSAHSKQPGLEHLRDVPAHHY